MKHSKQKLIKELGPSVYVLLAFASFCDKIQLLWQRERERRSIHVGIDYDGVIVKKPKGWDLPRRTSKMGLPTLPDTTEGLTNLYESSDVDVLGVYTVRPKWLREGQTRRQIEYRGIPLYRVTHSTNSSMEKVAAVLTDSLDDTAWSQGQNKEDFLLDDLIEKGLLTGNGKVGRIVLIDDSPRKVIEGALQLAEERPNLIPLLERFTLAAFDPKLSADLAGDIFPDSGIHVVTMRGWKDTGRMLDEVRSQMGG